MGWTIFYVQSNFKFINMIGHKYCGLLKCWAFLALSINHADEKYFTLDSRLASGIHRFIRRPARPRILGRPCPSFSRRVSRQLCRVASLCYSRHTLCCRWHTLGSIGAYNCCGSVSSHPDTCVFESRWQGELPCRYDSWSGWCSDLFRLQMTKTETPNN